MIVEVLSVITVALLIAFIVIYYAGGTSTYKGPSAVYKLKTKSINSEHFVLTNKELPWSGAPCAIRFGMFIKQAPRTVSKVDCITQAPTTETTVFKPSCKDYSFSTCKCDGMDCSKCSIEDSNTNYLFKLLNIGNSLELWASGYTSQNDKPYIPTILKIKTAKSSSEYFMESISLPAIPLQRWTIITIVKEGRRFDVYYGTVAVASKLLQYVPVPPDGDKNWRAGNPSWDGQIGFFNPVNGNWKKEDVERDVKGLVNTRGVPYYLEQVQFGLDLSVPEVECPLGNCNQSVTAKPQSPFLVWDSPYS